MPPSPHAAPLCPVTGNATASDQPDGPDGPAVSLTLPGDPRSPAIARHTVTAVLRAHGLTTYLWPAVLVAAELVAVSATLTPGRDLYLFLRHRDNALRLLVWDQHPRHATAATTTHCEARRRRALWLLPAVVDDWGGTWGITDARPPHQGTKTWATLPR